MEPEDWPKVKSIFDSVVLVGRGERTARLENVCAGDADLRREVEALLAAYDAAEDFMEQPFAAQVADQLPVQKSDELEPGDVFDRYKIVRKIGVGGMGKVYLAQDSDLKRLVAI